MSAGNGLSISLACLSASANAAAERVLLSALDSSYAAIQEGALTTLLARRSSAAERWILRHWHQLNEPWRNLVERNTLSLTSVLREAVVGSDLQICENACELALRLRDHDLIPSLVNAVENPNRACAARCSEALLQLSADLQGASRLPQSGGAHPDLQPVRRNVLAGLQRYLKRYQRQKPTEPIEAYLMLADVQDEALRKILLDSRDPAFVVVVYLLAHSAAWGVTRLLLDFIDDPHAPSAALNAISHRTDQEFLELLLDHLGDQPTEAARANLRRIESFSWLRDGAAWLAHLDERRQHGLVQFLLMTGVKRSEIQAVLAQLIQNGLALGRRAATKALAEFSGSDAASLTLRALEDQDPQVQALAVSQLRQRGLPHSLSLLLERLESPHHVVRQAARSSLAEYSFKRFLASFDILDEAARASTGELVKRVDPQTLPLLREQFRSDSRTRRLRAVAIAVTLDVCADCEAEALEMLTDQDHVVRSEGARMLGYCTTATVRGALEHALTDGSVAVREAAAGSIARLDAVGAGRSGRSPAHGPQEVQHA